MFLPKVRRYWMGAVLLLGGCASTQDVPLRVHSDPLGAYVLLEVETRRTSDGRDWVFLGNTPIDTTMTLDRHDVIKLRAMKEGYFDQTHSWRRRAASKQVQEKGRLFWNPRLVPAQE